MSRKPNPAYAVGTVHQSNNYGSFVITTYVDSTHIHIRFTTTDYTTITGVGVIKSGQIKDPYHPTILGIGYYGSGNYSSRAADNKRSSTVYIRWVGMLKRCYDPSTDSYTHYGAKGVTVYPAWFNYQVFAEWYYDECTRLGIDPDNNNHQIDKDIDCHEGKVMYSAHTCRLVLAQVNNELAKAKHYRFINPQGAVVEVYNLTKFCPDNGVSYIPMLYVHQGKQAKHRGWSKAA